MCGIGLVTGYPDGTFKPDNAITRAELITLALRFTLCEDITPMVDMDFSDIDGHWAEGDIRRALVIGWINGYPDGTFIPNRGTTRAEFITLMNRLLERIPETVADLLPGEMRIWPDNVDPGAWYYLAIQEATNSHEAAFKDKPVPGFLFNYERWVAMIPE
jgi:hypothetical protein